MSERVRILPNRALESSRTSRWKRNLVLPADLLKASRHRIGTFGLFCGFFFLIGTGLALKHIAHDTTMSSTYWVIFTLLFAADAFALWFLSRRSRLSDFAILKWGVSFEVVVCLFLSMGAIEMKWQMYGQLPDMSLAPLFIIFFPLIVPLPPLKTLINGVLAAAMSPLALWIKQGVHGFDADALAYATLTGPNVIAVAMSVFASATMHRMSQEVSRARQLGSYILDRKLGSGGMGEVWLARHQMLARPAAVKIIRPDVLGSEADSERLLERFQREAQVTATLSSPHTVELYDFGQTSDGTFYYVMERLDGMDLERLVEVHGPMPPERVVHILLQACDSLAEAHGRELVHRDIKPANLYLCRRGVTCDYLKVLDFGMVALQHARVGDDSRLTRDGALAAGTPAYMAPESAAGEDTGDGRVDMYALGCVAYWLLTGRLVFESKTPLQMVLKHVNEQPMPLSEVLETRVPERLEALVMRCLAKVPAERPQTMSELAAELRAIEAELEHPWTSDRAAQWWRKHHPDVLSPAKSGLDVLKTPVGDEPLIQPGRARDPDDRTSGGTAPTMPSPAALKG